MSQILDTQYSVGGYYILDSQEAGVFLSTLSVAVAQADNTVSVTAAIPSSLNVGITQADNLVSVAVAVFKTLASVTVQQTDNIVSIAMGTQSLHGSIVVQQANNTVIATARVARPGITALPAIVVNKGSNAILTFNFTTATPVIAYANLTIANGAKLGGVDFASTVTNGMLSNGVTISSGVLTIPAGISSFSISIPTY